MSDHGAVSGGRRKRPLVPDDQRKRVRKSCVPCKLKKLKCSGTTPCERCRNVRLSCHFPDTSSNSERRTQGSEKELILEAILRARNISIPQDLDALKAYAERLQSGSNSAEGSRHDASVVIDRLPTPQTYVHDQSKTYFDAGSSAWAFFDSVRDTVDKAPTLRADRQTAHKHFIVEPPSRLSDNLRTSLISALPPRQVLDYLVLTFFRYSQSNFFFIHPVIFTRKLDAFLSGIHEFSPEGSSSSKHPNDFICILFMVLAIGSQYAELEQSRGIPQSIPVSLDNSTLHYIFNTPVPKPTPNPGWRFYKISRQLLSDVVSSCSMTSIQVCVLQGTFLVHTSAHDVAYNVFGLAMRMAISMGMHRAISGSNLHPQVQELRNRLWWSVYTHERLLTFHLGRPLMLDDQEIDAAFPADMPELRTSQVSSSIDGQIALIKLCQLTGKVIKLMYAQTNSPRGERVVNTASFTQLKSELQQWKADLPESLQLSPTSTRGAVHLHLTHEQAVMLLSRVPLTYAASFTDNGINQLQPEPKSRFLQDAARDCVAAALTTIQLLQTLQNRGLLCRHSCQDPLYCSSALHVLLLGARLHTPTDITKRTIVEGILLLRDLAKGSETAASSLPFVLSGFRPFFWDESNSAIEPSTSPNNKERAEGHRAWQEWISASENPVTPCGTLDDGGIATSYLQELQSMLTDHGDEGQAARFELQTNADVELTGPPMLSITGEAQIVSPDNEQFALQDQMNDWFMTGQPFWLPELKDNFNVLERDLTETTAGGNLNIWDSIAIE